MQFNNGLPCVAIISFTVLTSDAGVCFHGKKGFTGVGFDTVVAEGRGGGGCGGKKVSETKDDMGEGEKAVEPG